MLNPRIIHVLIAAAVIAGVNLASAQSYPNRLIRIIVGGTGNSFYIRARIIAQGITGPLGQPVIVDNRANGPVASELVAKAPPDGYTLLVTGSSQWVFPILH